MKSSMLCSAAGGFDGPKPFVKPRATSSDIKVVITKKTPEPA
jgi:hypothetical protein